LGLVAIQFRTADGGALRFFHKGGLGHELHIGFFRFLGAKLEFFRIDLGADGSGLQVKESLIPIGLGAANSLIVRFLVGGQVGHELLDAVFELDERILIIVEALLLVLGVELADDIAGLDLASGLGKVQQHEIEIAARTAGTTAAAHIAAATTTTAAL